MVFFRCVSFKGNHRNHPKKNTPAKTTAKSWRRRNSEAQRAKLKKQLREAFVKEARTVAVAAALVGVCRPWVTYPPGGWGWGEVVERVTFQTKWSVMMFGSCRSNAKFPKFGGFCWCDVFCFHLNEVMFRFNFPQQKLPAFFPHPRKEAEDMEATEDEKKARYSLRLHDFSPFTRPILQEYSLGHV